MTGLDYFACDVPSYIIGCGHFSNNLSQQIKGISYKFMFYKQAKVPFDVRFNDRKRRCYQREGQQARKLFIIVYLEHHTDQTDKIMVNETN